MQRQHYKYKSTVTFFMSHNESVGSYMFSCPCLSPFNSPSSFSSFFSPECTLQGNPAHAGGQAEASESG